MKKFVYRLFIVVLLSGSVSSSAEGKSRMQRVAWTDRSLSNPPLVEHSSIDSTISQFWNVTLVPESKVETEVEPKVSYRSTVPAKPGPSTRVSQDRNTKERRGYFGINLFNVIPLIDFVHGEAQTTSLDHVEGQK
ncbi:MAG: hypothetical protein O7C75_16800 [Verrucomicrobia bacterium]|nr:hypothetical protein [Verrucomicrobiota bacterium]